MFSWRSFIYTIILLTIDINEYLQIFFYNQYNIDTRLLTFIDIYLIFINLFFDIYYSYFHAYIPMK